MIKYVMCKRSGGVITVQLLKDLKIVLTDCDGVLTDGGMYYYDNGVEGKKFNTKDGMAFHILKNNDIKVGIITGEKTKIVENRAKKLNVDYLYMGIRDKYQILLDICKQENISLQNVAYLGDDINDLQVLQNVGFSACPKDAQKDVKNVCKYISNKNGGEGVVRDFLESYLVIHE